MKKVLLVTMAALMFVSFSFAGTVPFRNNEANTTAALQMDINTLATFYEIGLSSSQAEAIYDYLTDARVKLNTINAQKVESLNDMEDYLLDGDFSSYKSLNDVVTNLDSKLEAIRNDVTSKASETLKKDQINVIQESFGTREGKGVEKEVNVEQMFSRHILSHSFISVLGNYIDSL